MCVYVCVYLRQREVNTMEKNKIENTIRIVNKESLIKEMPSERRLE